MNGYTPADLSFIVGSINAWARQKMDPSRDFFSVIRTELLREREREYPQGTVFDRSHDEDVRLVGYPIKTRSVVF